MVQGSFAEKFVFFYFISRHIFNLVHVPIYECQTRDVISRLKYLCYHDARRETGRLTGYLPSHGDPHFATLKKDLPRKCFASLEICIVPPPWLV